MNINKYNLYPLNYTIVYCSSSDPNFPIYNINKKSRYSDFIPISSDISLNNELTEKYNKIYFNVGWSSLRFCSYPQTIILQLSSISDIKQINIELNHERIPQKIDVYVYCPTTFKEVVSNFNEIISSNFTYIGSVVPVKHNGNRRELKKLIFHNNGNFGKITIMNCLYVKFVVHKNYDNPNNKFNQVGIINIDIFGNHNNRILPVLPLKKVEPFKIDEIIPRLKGLYRDCDYDDYIREKIEKAKLEYYTNEVVLNDEEKKNKIYQDIQIMRDLGIKVLELKKEKERFEFFENDNKLMQINLKLNEIKNYIEETYPYYGKENIKYENENDMTKDETGEYFINLVENNLESNNEMNNTNISNGNNISENNNINISAGEEEKSNSKNDNNVNNIQNINNNIDNNNYDINNKTDNYNNNYIPIPVSEKSKEILRRHQEKKRMIKENKEMAEYNRKKV